MAFPEKTDDWQLLNDYATRGSEDSFRTLVDRYAGMVYHAALRQTANPHVAEEITQAVFVALAQKAGKISQATLLYGWLFRATRYAALNLIRAETSRHRHQKQAHDMQTNLQADDSESVWDQISPLLDNALSQLRTGDREVVMIRFFGRKSHKETADLLGITEDTAKKRVSRALERLRVIFAKRGVAVPVIGLTVAFLAFGAQAAPAGLTSTAIAALGSGGVGTPTLLTANAILKQMAWAKAKTATVLVSGMVLLAAGTGLVVSQMSQSFSGIIIDNLQHRTGQTIVCDHRLNIPSSFNFYDRPLEETLDELCVQAGGYWSLDYAVYDSKASLRRLIETLREGTDLNSAGWTNVAGPLRLGGISMVSGTNLRDFGDVTWRPTGHLAGMIRMKVIMNDVPVPNSPLEEKMGDKMRRTTAEINRIISEGTAEGILVPERMLLQKSLVPRLAQKMPCIATRETAIEIARDTRASWAVIYTLRKSPLDGAAIKLAHNGAQPYGQTNHVALEAIMSNVQTNRLNLTPDEVSAHEEAVKNWKQTNRSGANSP